MRLLPCLSLVLFCLPAAANDGRNRYEQGLAAELVHWHAPVSAQGGYRVLAEDMAGGADGDPAYRWVNRHALALTRWASHRTVQQLGLAPLPYPVFDLASENADTPLQITDQGARGRHPGGSHDGGYNLDLGYYMTSEQGKLERPDYAACTEHHRPKADGGWEDAHQCTGPADRLDTPRQTLFLLELLRVHRERFGSQLIEAIGIDAQVRAAVLAQARAWGLRRQHGSSAAAVAELDRLFASSPYEGWATSHHHHIHLRLRPLDPSGPHREALRALLEQDRDLEARLLAAPDAEAGGAQAGCALLTELSSYALNRTVSLRLHGAACKLQSGSLRFRWAGGDWQAPRDPLQPRFHALPAAAGASSSTALAEAAFTLADGRIVQLRRNVALPAQPGWLRVRAEPRDFVAQVQPDGEARLLRVDFPPAHRVLIDKLELVLRRAGSATLERLPIHPAQPQLRLPEGEGQARIELLEVEVGLSRRIRWRLPVGF